MVHGRLEPGGAAERHLHRRSAQVTHILAGRCTVDLDGERDALGPGDTVFIAPGVMHEVIVDGDQALELINVYQPPLQPDDICTGEDEDGRADGVGGDVGGDGVAADLGRKSGGDGPADGVAP